MGERSRPRDLYDIVNLFRRPDFLPYAALVREILAEKCSSKGIAIPSVESIRTSPMFDELETEWANMLDHQLRALPDFDHFWSELPRLFAWLRGEESPEPVPLAAEEDLWTPPPTFWTTGLGNRLEPVRFAAVNRLLVDLGYQGEHRLIEPYSLRQSRAGDILLHALRAESREHRAYRLDRIESARVTTQPFTPSYAIEFQSRERSQRSRRLVAAPGHRGLPGEVAQAQVKLGMSCSARCAASASGVSDQGRDYGVTRTPAVAGTAQRGQGGSISSASCSSHVGCCR